MKLREFFLAEDGDNLEKRAERLAALHEIDPRATAIDGHAGLSSCSLFYGRKNDIWKVGIENMSISPLKGLKGKKTKTLVPVLDVVELSNGDWAVRMPKLRELSIIDLQKIYTVITDNGRDEDGNDFVKFDPDAEPATLSWIHDCFAELESAGLFPPDFQGEENFMQDSNGDWRYIDLA